MKKNKTQLAIKVRINIGSPTQSQIGEPKIEDAIDGAVYEYSRYKPKTVYTTFETQADVAEVAMSEVIPGSTVIDVLDCLWNPIGISLDPDLYRTIPEIGESGLSGISVFHNPSIVIQLQQKMESFRRQYGGDWDYYDGTLRLLPAPSSDGIKVGVIATCAKSLSEIPDSDEDTLLLWAEAQAVRILLEKRANIASVSMEGASINFNIGDARKSVEDREKKFQKKLGGHLGVFSTG